MRYRLQRHDGTDCSATMVPITVLRMVPIQRYRHLLISVMLGLYAGYKSNNVIDNSTKDQDNIENSDNIKDPVYNE